MQAIKKEVTNYIKELGGTSNYQGRTQTLFVTGEESITDKVRERFFQQLPFKIEFNKDRESKMTRKGRARKKAENTKKVNI